VEILLVEDNPEDAEMTIGALKKHQIARRIHHVPSGEEALDFLFAAGAYRDRLPAEAPKLVLLDLQLPGVGGLEVLRKIRSDERTRMVPVVVMTSSDRERDLVESYRLGTNSYVVKPLEFGRFTEAVRQLGLYWLLANQGPR
jgi:CheY-like chemotaxis protein